jgi:hypothetical protein
MRGRQKADPPLVADLLDRLRPYAARGVVCRRCRSFVTEEGARGAGWSFRADTDGVPRPYCPECAASEFGVGRDR